MLREHIQNARDSLRTTRSRTLLTVLGVTIGIASITAILSLASGINSVIGKQVSDLAGNIAVIRPNAKPGGINDIANPTPFQAFATSTVTEKDYTDISKLNGIKYAAPLMLINGTATSRDQSVDTAPIIATTPSLAEIAKLKTQFGQFLDEQVNQDAIVLGKQLSIDLFGTEQSLGKLLTIRGQQFQVIGVLDKQNDPINYNNVDFDNTAIIGLERGKTFNQGIAQIQQINIQATSEKALKPTMANVAKLLNKNHGGEKDYTILTGREIAQPTSRLYSAIAGVTAAIAGISLIVGGVGIMNIMLVGVAERTREIGIRKAVGASDGNIVMQFLTEALIMSFVGGVLGYLIGFTGAFLIGTFLTFGPTFSWVTLAIALGTSISVGAIFGIYPAIRAARKDPIESLRQYH